VPVPFVPSRNKSVHVFWHQHEGDESEFASRNGRSRSIKHILHVLIGCVRPIQEDHLSGGVQ
jgi:hypothetical protein